MTSHIPNLRHAGPGSLALFLLGCIGAPCHAQDQPAPPAAGQTWMEVTPMSSDPVPVLIEPEVHDLGDLPPNTTTLVEFRVTNMGEQTLRLKGVMSTCSCAVPKLDIKEIEPGQMIVLPVSFYSGNNIVTQDREVIMRFEGYGKSAAPRIRASTNYGIRPAVEYTPPAQRRVGVVTLRATDEVPFRVVSANLRAPVAIEGGVEPGSPAVEHSIRFDLSDPLAEDLPEWFVIETDHARSPLIDLTVENLEWAPPRMFRPWDFSDRRLVLGTLPPGADKDFTIRMRRVKEGGLEGIQNIWVDPPVADVRLMGMEQREDGIHMRLRLSPKEGHRGVLFAYVGMTAFDHDEKFAVIATVVDPSDSR